jgi:hypothetical protein
LLGPRRRARSAAKMCNGKRLSELCHEPLLAESSSRFNFCMERFCYFDKQYFGGRLGDYRVRVRFDLDLGFIEPHDHLERCSIDLSTREIFLPATRVGGYLQIEYLLIKLMAHASTATTADDDPRFLAEMQRLTDLGAPVIKREDASKASR